MRYGMEVSGKKEGGWKCRVTGKEDVHGMRVAWVDGIRDRSDMRLQYETLEDYHFAHGRLHVVVTVIHG